MAFSDFFKNIFKPKNDTRKPDVKQIYKTTDGYLSGNARNKKPRHVVVVDQRVDDGALAVSKIHSKEGKKGDWHIKHLTLKPKKHESLTKPSAVEHRVIVGVKEPGTKRYKPIKSRDMQKTNDRVTNCEYKRIKRGLGGKTRANRTTAKNTLAKWHNHFKGTKK